MTNKLNKLSKTLEKIKKFEFKAMEELKREKEFAENIVKFYKNQPSGQLLWDHGEINEAKRTDNIYVAHKYLQEIENVLIVWNSFKMVLDRAIVTEKRREIEEKEKWFKSAIIMLRGAMGILKYVDSNIEETTQHFRDSLHKPIGYKLNGILG